MNERKCTRITWLALVLLLTSTSVYLSACSSDESEPEATNDAEETETDIESETDDTSDVEIDEDTESDTGDAVADVPTDSDSTSDADAISYPFDVAIITKGCEAFDGCGLIDQFGGSVDDCLDYANGLLIDSAECVDELEASFGCAGDAGSCNFETECAGETKALSDCRK